MEDSALRIARLAQRGWVSLREFATIVGVSYPTICRMRDNNNFRYVKVGETYRIYTDEVRRFLERGNLQDDPIEREAAKADGVHPREE